MADIKLKDIGGEEKTYSGIKHIKTPGSTGEQVEFDLEPTLQEKSIENKKNGVTEVSADTGYDGLSKVKVKTSVPPTMQEYRFLIPSRQPQKSDWEDGATSYPLFESSANDTGGILNGLLGIVGFVDGQPPVVNIVNFGGFTPTGIPSDAHLFYSWQELNAVQLAAYRFGGIYYTYADTAVLPIGWSYSVLGESGNITSFISINTDTARLPIGSDAYDGKYFNNYFYELFTLASIKDKTVTATQNGTTTIRADHAALGIHQVDLTVDVPQTPTEEKTVELAMSSGNQVVTPSGGKVLSKVTVTKPDTMLPENIKNGINIGGVVGTLVSGGGETEEVTVDLSMADGNQVITPSAGKSISKATVTKPSTLIPANIKKDVVIGGVTGTLDTNETLDDYKIAVMNFGDAVGDGTVIISPNKLEIKAWGKGTYDLSYTDESYSVTPSWQKITSPEVKTKLNSMAEYLLTGSPSPLDQIFSDADAVEFCGVVFDKPSFSGITEKTWDNLMVALSFPSSWMGPKYIEPTKWYIDNGYGDYTAATFPMIWYPIYEKTTRRLYAYSLQTPTGTMPTYDTGIKVVKGRLNAVFMNAMPAYGVTANVVAVITMIFSAIFCYSYGATTIPEAFLQKLEPGWTYGNVTLSEGWNQTVISGNAATTTTITEQQAYDNFADAYEGGLPIDDYNYAVYGLSDYEKSVFKPIYKADYYRGSNPLKIELNIVKEITA